jgi:two-component system CheB/CheR fusion protein
MVSWLAAPSDPVINRLEAKKDNMSNAPGLPGVSVERPIPRRRRPITLSADMLDHATGTTRPNAAEYRSRGDLKSILNNAGVATLVVDRDGRLRFFTPAAASLFRITAADFGRPLADLTRLFVDPDLILAVQTVMATRVTLRRAVRADNGVWYSRRLSPHRTADNGLRGAVITFVDISEMKLAEEESEAARAYSNSIVDTIRQPLVVLDHDLRIVSASPSFYRSFALTPMSAVGRRLPDLRDRCLDVPALRSFLDRIAAGDDVAEDYEIDIDLPPRGRRVLALNVSKILMTPPAQPQTLLAIDDITERRQVRAALQAAKALAERANLGKSRFLAAASHDLRQPLQTIALLQGLLAAKATDADGVRLVAKLGESLDVMSGTLNKLLDINQLEAGIVKPEVENFPISVLFDRLRGEIAYQAEGATLACHIVSSRHIVRSDSALLEQMLRNLLSNAQKYTIRGKILLGCRRRGDKLRIEVWDTGPGIPSGQLRAIFDEFHQLDNPARERARGLGLGLSIVQRLADLLGHTVDVRSRLGKGSVFAIEVPCLFGKTPPPTVRPAPHRQPAVHASQGETILVVDDDPAILELLTLLLETGGYRTAAAADGNEALKLATGGGLRPDIVVADYNLPNGMNGLEIAARLREIVDPALPIVILTGDISSSTLRTIADARCAQANKPFKAAELMRLIRKQLATRRQMFDPLHPPHDVIRSGVDEAAPTVFLIDDDDDLRETMRELIERQGQKVEGFASCEAFLAAYRTGRKGCVLIDAQLPGMSGLELLQWLKIENFGLPSIMITGNGEVSMAVDAMKAGASDFIEKPVRHEELMASIGRALRSVNDSAASAAWREGAARLIAGLTARERQIMDLVIRGHPNKIIAADLGVSQRTVENHRAAVMKKTHSKSLSDLVRLAIAAA